VEDESTWEILEVTATCLRQSKPKNPTPPTPIQKKTYKISKPIHKKTQIFQHRSNQNSQTTANPTLQRTTKTKKGQREGRGSHRERRERRALELKRDLERSDIESKINPSSLLP